MFAGGLGKACFNSSLTWLRGNATPLADAEISRGISFARIALMIGLVFLHYGSYPNATTSPFDGFDPAHNSVATLLNSFTLFFFFSTVPLLSMVSGWLFFSFAAHDAPRALRKRIHRRIRSLYLPLVFWNTLYLALAAGLFIAAPHTAVLDQLNLDFSRAGWRNYVNAIFAVTQHPLAFQFWFVRDLLVTVFISPILWWLLRRAPYVGVAVLGGAWLLGHDLWIFFRTDVLFFFYLGALLRTRRASLHVAAKPAMTILAIYIVLVALRTLAPLAIDLEPQRPAWLEDATRAMRLVGVVACWGIFLQLARTRFGRFMAQYGGLAFFLFATHYPLIAVVKQTLWPWVPEHGQVWLVIHYAASVLITVSISLTVGLLLARLAPSWFALMNGGRLIPVAQPRPSSTAVPAA